MGGSFKFMGDNYFHQLAKKRAASLPDRKKLNPRDEGKKLK